VPKSRTREKWSPELSPPPFRVKRQSVFNHVTFSGAGHRRYSTGAANQVIQFFGANQVLQFAYEAIMF
jgi:hypothetical protein